MAFTATIQVTACRRSGVLRTWNAAGADLSAPFWRLYWAATPGLAVEHGGLRHALGPQRVLLIAPHTAYRTIVQRAAEHWFMHFVLIPDFDGPTDAVHAVPAWPGLATLIQEEGGASLPQRRARALAVITTALAALPEAVAVGGADPGLAAAIALLHDNLHRRVSTAELARASDLHPQVLLRRFHARLGCTPSQHHRRLRIRRACALLGDRNRSLAAIAEACGFCDRSHLAKTLLAVTGESPSGYRQRLLQIGR